MNDSFTQQVAIAVENLSADLKSIAFAQLFFLGYVFAQVAMWTVFENEVVVVRGLDDLVEMNDILMVEVAVDGNLRFEEIDVGPSEFFEVDDLNRIALVWLKDLYAFIYFTAVAFAQLITGVILVFSHSHLGLFQKSCRLLASECTRNASLTIEGSKVIPGVICAH